MSKLSIAAAISIILFTFSCQKKEEAPLLAQHLEEIEEIIIIDSSLITIPYSLELNPVSEVYAFEKERQVSEFYSKKIGLSDFSGALLVAKNGKIIFEDYKGYANFETKTPISQTTALHLASVSKVMTATLVLKLVQENKIDLNEKVQTYLPDFPYQNTTVRTLLNHRSGLP